MFAPPEDRTLLIVGQERVAIQDFVAQVGAPAGYMVYSDLESQAGLSGPVGEGGGCADAGIHDLPSARALLPRGVAQIGLALTNGQVVPAANGALDGRIRALAETLRAHAGPVLLRIGYEAEGSWNAYPPGAYQRAFRRIVSVLRGNRVGGTAITPVPHVAFVWHLAASRVGTAGNIPFEQWYPGDGYVDWVAVSWFGEWPPHENASRRARDDVAAFARAHGKRLMIGESTPRVYYPLHEPSTWDLWYEEVVRWIAANDVRVWSLINQDWRAYPMFAGGCDSGGDIWGDSRIQYADASVRASWDAEMSGPRWYWDRMDLWSAISF